MQRKLSLLFYFLYVLLYFYELKCQNLPKNNRVDSKAANGKRANISKGNATAGYGSTTPKYKNYSLKIAKPLNISKAKVMIQ